MKIEQRDGVLSASANQHGTTVVCTTHSTALGLQEEFGGEVSRDRLWKVRFSPSGGDEHNSDQQSDGEAG